MHAFILEGCDEDKGHVVTSCEFCVVFADDIGQAAEKLAGSLAQATTSGRTQRFVFSAETVRRIARLKLAADGCSQEVVDDKHAQELAEPDLDLYGLLRLRPILALR